MEFSKKAWALKAANNKEGVLSQVLKSKVQKRSRGTSVNKVRHSAASRLRLVRDSLIYFFFYMVQYQTNRISPTSHFKEQQCPVEGG